MSTHRPPNILWIQTDEQRPDSLGCYGSGWAKTPNLDELAERGVTFRRAFCQSPVSVPSRSSQMTCRYPQEIGVLNNPIDHYDGKVYPDDAVMFTEVFADAGYQTVNFGKRHIAKRPTSWHRHDSRQVDSQYAGFFALADRYADEDYRVIKRPGGSPIILAGTYPGSLTDNPSRRITDWAIDYLRTRDVARPFLLRVSHNYPHTPVLPPPPFDRLYCHSELPVRYYDHDAYACRSAADRRIADSHNMRALTRQQYEQIWCDYMGLCGYVDYEVGRLLAAVKALGLEDNTLIVYSADHGKMLGEWGAGEKGVFDDPVWRGPFIWSWPGHLPQGEQRDDLCEMLDMGKTLLGLTRLTDRTPPSWRGRDLFDASATAPQFVVGQIGMPNRNAPLALATEPNAGSPNYNPRPLHMAIRTQRYRLDLPWMKDGRRITELDGNLFDLEADPQERVNLWSDPQHAETRADLLRQLEAWFDTTPKHPGLFEDA